MNYIVTTRSAQGLLHSLVWDPSAPLPLGYPLQWIVEKIPGTGIRVRHISPERGEVHQGGLKLIEEKELERGTEIDLPTSGKKGHLVSLAIRPARRVLPAYEEGQGDRLNVFSCSGLWVMDSEKLDRAYEAKHEKKSVFALTRTKNAYMLTAKADLTILKTGEKTQAPFATGEKIEMTMAELVGTRVFLGPRNWRFGLSDDPVLPPLAKSATHDEELHAFKKSVRYSLATLAGMIVLAWVWPKPDPLPVDQIPPQIARLVLTRPAQPAPVEPQGQQVGQTKEVAKTKVQETKVVQAFRAKALQNAVSNLLKGGMTKLLAQSDFVSGAASQNARKIFDAKSDALRATGPEIGLNTSKSVLVASIGSQGIGGVGRAGKAVGYGKGERASVKGQGENFVSMDIGNASVEEGLTKEEVGKIIHQHLSEIRYCYEAAMLRTPDIEGKLVMDFTIGGGGDVKVSLVKQSTLPDPRLDDCVLRRLVTWKFPKTKGGVDVAVTYPFIFKTLGR